MLTKSLSRIGLVALYALLLLAIAQPSSAERRESGLAPQVCWDSSCYRTYDQIHSYLLTVAATYPQIATLSDAGASWEGTRHLWLLHISSNVHPDPKPALYMLGGQQARDVAAPELVLRYVDYLTRNYGVDPDVTWLIDNRNLYLLPLANPDGYFQVYNNGQCSRLKNTDNTNGCADPLYWGTALKLNYPFHWNSGGTSLDPCQSSYPGPSALSEPESAHILDSINAVSPGLVVQLSAPDPNSIGRSIRYPWGWTTAAPSQVAGFDALAWALARLNGTPRGSVFQHSHGPSGVTSGILDDTMYSNGIPALTVQAGDSPYLICPDVDAVWLQQLPAFLYASKAVASTSGETLSHPFGPTARDLGITGSDLSPRTVQFTAVLSSNVGTVQGAVYKIDDPGQ